MSLIGTLDQAVQVRDKLLGQAAGKTLLHQKHPDDFEYYMCAIELLKSDLSTEKYFIFPILPSSLSYNDSPITKITKTAGGISVMKSDQFIPKTLSLSGTFGRSFKVLVGKDSQDLVASFRNDSGKVNFKSIISGIAKAFDSKIKTGYGCCKILENILMLSNQKDEFDKPRFLIFYNLAFNQKFFIEYEEQTWNMTLETNMVWSYSLRLKAIAQGENFLKNRIDGVKSNKQLVVDNFIQKQANRVYSGITTLLNKKLSKF